MTPDLVRLREALEDLQDVVDSLELELVDDPDWAEPSDTSYLTKADLANPDIVANVSAMAVTNKLISWFGKDMEGYVGLWRGPLNHPLDKAPVVRLDSEGQYAIVAATIADYLAISVSEDELEEVQEALAAAGFKPSASREEIWKNIEIFSDDPNEFRNKLYEATKKPPTGGNVANSRKGSS
jgi:hypothetical protein